MFSCKLTFFIQINFFHIFFSYSFFHTNFQNCGFVVIFVWNSFVFYPECPELYRGIRSRQPLWLVSEPLISLKPNGWLWKLNFEQRVDIGAMGGLVWRMKDAYELLSALNKFTSIRGIRMKNIKYQNIVLNNFYCWLLVNKKFLKMYDN